MASIIYHFILLLHATLNARLKQFLDLAQSYPITN